MEDFTITTTGGRPARYGIFLDGVSGGNPISGFLINHIEIQQLGNAGIATNGPTPPDYDGIFTSSISNSAIAGGLNLQNAGDSLTITGNVFNGTGTITVNLIGQNSDTAHGFNFFHNNVTCTGGINVINAWGWRDFLQQYRTLRRRHRNQRRRDQPRRQRASAARKFRSPWKLCRRRAGLRLHRHPREQHEGTRIEGNTLPRAPGGFVIVTTPNADRTEIMMNREQPYGEMIASWLSDSGTNTIVELIDPNTGKLTFSQQVNFSSGISINGFPALNTTSQTGSGNLVLSNSPTLTNPNLGDATANSITLGNGVTLGNSAALPQFFVTPTAGLLVCIKSAGPPIQLGTCSEVLRRPLQNL